MKEAKHKKNLSITSHPFTLFTRRPTVFAFLYLVSDMPSYFIPLTVGNKEHDTFQIMQNNCTVNVFFFCFFFLRYNK